MSPVRLEIQQIVHEVDRRSAQAECYEGEQAGQHGTGIAHPMSCKQRHQYQDVLGPLVRPQRTDYGPQRAPARRKCAYNFREAGGILLQPRSAVNYNRSACAPPDRKIFALVSAVVEATLAESCDELGCL